MSKQFLFGAMYDTESENFKEMKNKLYKEKTPFEINKNTFIVSNYDKESTMKVLYNKLKKNAIPIEVAKNKDLMYFSTPELIDFMTFIPTYSVSTKEGLYHLIDNYLDWSVSIGNIQSNNLKGLDKSELCKVNKKSVKHKVMGTKEFFSYCEIAEKSEEISVVDIMLLVLARYGIVGEKLSWIVNLKYSNLDFENKIVRIVEGNNTIELPVDDMFFTWLDKCMRCKGLYGFKYEDSDNIIRKTTKFKETEIDDVYIYNRVDRIFKQTIFPRVSFKLLEFSRKVDLLLDIRKERVLTIDDFRIITKMFNPNSALSSANSLARFYESLTLDRVQPMRIKPEEIEKYTDDNSRETVRNIKKQIGY